MIGRVMLKPRSAESMGISRGSEGMLPGNF